MPFPRNLPTRRPKNIAPWTVLTSQERFILEDSEYLIAVAVHYDTMVKLSRNPDLTTDNDLMQYVVAVAEGEAGTPRIVRSRMPQTWNDAHKHGIAVTRMLVALGADQEIADQMGMEQMAHAMSLIPGVTATEFDGGTVFTRG